MKPIPAPDPFNPDLFPFGKEAGANKFNLTTCPTCGKPASHPTLDQWPWPSSKPAPAGFFMFRNELSAREYAISGMCQACQDSVFGVD